MYATLFGTLASLRFEQPLKALKPTLWSEGGRRMEGREWQSRKAPSDMRDSLRDGSWMERRDLQPKKA